MKNRIIYLIIFLSFFTVKTAYTQLFDEEDKQKILANLDSTGYEFLTLKQIVFYRITEAIPILESKFWGKSMTTRATYLDVIAELKSPNAVSFALALLDSAETVDLPNPLITKLRATKSLFKLNDYSTANYIFEWLEEYHQGRLGLEGSFAIMMLPKLLDFPEYEEQVKEELIYVARNEGFADYRSLAIDALAKKYGAEFIPFLLERVREDTTSYVRWNAFINLRKLDYYELHSLILERLPLESEFIYRVFYADTLLKRYGQPSDYYFLKNYLPSENHPQAKEMIGLYFKYQKPPKQSLSFDISESIDSLISYSHQLNSFGWIGDQNYVNSLVVMLETVKSYLLNLDSLSGRTGLEEYQQNVDFVFKDSLNSNPQFVLREGWNILYWNAQYILDRLPEITTVSEISTYSIFGTHGVWLEQNSEIISGNIGVNEIGQPPFMDSGVEMSIGISTETPAGFSVKANRIKVKQGATVNADVYYNELENNGTITGTLNTPLELPLFTSLPEFHTSTPGTENIVVPQNGEYTLTSGAYGDIQVKKNGKLIFTGGEYHINKFTGGDNNQLLFQSESEVRIKDKFDSGQGTYIGPEDTTTMSANEIIFYVEGINGTNGNLGATPKAAKIGISNNVKASFYVPNGTLWLRKNSEVEGSFIGKDVDVGIGVKVKLKSAF